jgi:hypothetical protein
LHKEKWKELIKLREEVKETIMIYYFEENNFEKQLYEWTIENFEKGLTLENKLAMNGTEVQNKLPKGLNEKRVR